MTVASQACLRGFPQQDKLYTQTVSQTNLPFHQRLPGNSVIIVGKVMSTGAVSQVPLAIFSTQAHLTPISYTGAPDEQLTLIDQRHGQPFVNVALKGLPLRGTPFWAPWVSREGWEL